MSSICFQYFQILLQFINLLLGPSSLKHCETQSARWFEALGYQQFICGYYGTGNGTQSAMEELAGVANISGLLGMVYGSWAKHVPGDPALGGGDYSQLEEYAAAARKFWPGGGVD